MFKGIILGLVIGYFFKPQIEIGIKKIIRTVKGNIKRDQ